MSPGNGFEVEVEICNHGDTDSSQAYVDVVLSADTVIDAGDSVIANISINSLYPGRCERRQVFTYSPPGPGIWILGAIVDPWDHVYEADESNNASVGTTLAAGYESDLVVTSVSGPGLAVVGFEATVTVCNEGQSWSYFSDVSLVLSADSTIDITDEIIGTLGLGSLAPGQCITDSVWSTASLSEGEHTLGAIVDAWDSEPELIESNNTRAGGTIGIGPGPELVVTSVTAPASAWPYSNFEVTATVCNLGIQPSNPAELEIKLSVDDTIDVTDDSAGLVPLPGIPSDSCTTVIVNAAVTSPEGVYTLGALVDPLGSVQEVLESNNTAISGTFGVGAEPDLIVASVTAPASAPTYGSFMATATVCNQGQDLGYADVHFVLVPYGGSSAGRPAVGQAVVGALAPGECRTLSAPVSSYAPTGVYALSAIVDPYGYELELVESNNTANSEVIGLGSEPDLVVTAVTAPASSMPYSDFAVTATVCNQGQGWSYGTNMDVFLSADSTITMADEMAGSAPVGALEPGQCTTLSIQAYASVSQGAYTLGAIVDTYNYTFELLEENNTKAAGILGIGYEPDLVITKMTGPATALPYSSIMLMATVCNQGQGPSSSSDVSVFLSGDGTIGLSEDSLGNAPVPGLAAGSCTEVAIPASANRGEGVFTLAAVVDRFHYVPEILDSNNTWAGALIGIGYGPDLVITEVTGPASARPGSSFAVTATVCNQGQNHGYSTDVDIVLSADSTIGSSDPVVGSGWIYTPGPGQCATVSVPYAYASVHDGVYTLGAIVDPRRNEPELIESNNTHAGGVIGIGFEPDLVVTKVTGPATALPGSSFAVTATVCNQGQDRDYVEVELVLSADGVIDASDAPIGYMWAGYLDATQCTTVSGSAYAHVPEGVYTLGAVVDRYQYVPELIESNNTHAGGMIGIGSGPDLVITQVTGPATLLPWSSFAVTATVCNQGQGPSSSGHIEAVLSRDAAINQSDDLVGGAPVPNLPAGACVAVNIPAYAHVPEGVYTLGAVVDRYQSLPELIESNNTHAGGVIGIGSGPDLVVTKVTGPASALPGSSFAVTATVCNQGQDYGYSTDVDIVLSADSAIGSSDPVVGSGWIYTPAPGQCTTVSMPYTNAWVPDGVYTLGAIVDPRSNEPELIESNNTHAGGVIGIGSGPDLVITQVTGPASALPGSSLTVTATVCNQGQSRSYADVEIVLSADGVIDTSDMPIGYLGIGYLDVAQCTTVSGPAYAQVPEGVYTLGAVVDRYQSVPELIESNNTHAGGVIGMGSGPDLVITQVTGPASALPGSPFTITATVCNQGQGPNSSGQIEAVLSRDAVIDQSDDPMSGASVPGLAPGACIAVDIPAYANMPEGVYTLGAVVDRFQYVPELIESNNAQTGALIGIGFGPDLVITEVTGPASALPGSVFTIEATVCNQGQSQSDATEVQSVLSASGASDLPGAGTGSDVWMGSAWVGPLAPGGCDTVSVPASSQVPEGVYTLGAVVDRFQYVPELIESNNAQTGALIGIGAGPDLVITEVTGPATVQPGGSFTATATVCNQGNYAAYADYVSIVMSADDVIDTSDPMVGQEYVSYLDPGDCTPVSIPAYAHVPEGVHILGAIVDRYQYVPELIESNNTRAGSLVDVGFGPNP